jgi:methylated-DNA-[protein]-cysteine S-methyltransferase
MSTYEVSKVSSSVGDVEISATLKGVARVRFVTWPVRAPKHPVFKQASAFAEEARVQLSEYLAGKRRNFNVPFDLSQTDHKQPATLFQQKVWIALLRIPFGSYVTYGELARMIGRPGGAQAVGQAVKINPICIMVPCHRVLPTQTDEPALGRRDRGLYRRDMAIGGYNGGVRRKAWLLDHEYRALTGAPRRIAVVEA